MEKPEPPQAGGRIPVDKFEEHRWRLPIRFRSGAGQAGHARVFHLWGAPSREASLCDLLNAVLAKLAA